LGTGYAVLFRTSILGDGRSTADRLKLIDSLISENENTYPENAPIPDMHLIPYVVSDLNFMPYRIAALLLETTAFQGVDIDNHDPRWVERLGFRSDVRVKDGEVLMEVGRGGAATPPCCNRDSACGSPLVDNTVKNVSRAYDFNLPQNHRVYD
jgi:hypothetical protein